MKILSVSLLLMASYSVCADGVLGQIIAHSLFDRAGDEPGHCSRRV